LAAPLLFLPRHRQETCHLVAQEQLASLLGLQAFTHPAVDGGQPLLACPESHRNQRGLPAQIPHLPRYLQRPPPPCVLELVDLPSHLPVLLAFLGHETSQLRPFPRIFPPQFARISQYLDVGIGHVGWDPPVFPCALGLRNGEALNLGPPAQRQ